MAARGFHDPKRYAKAWALASPETSDLYALDDGHGWDSLHAIASEYARRDITWNDVRRLVARDLADMARAQEATTSTGGAA
jgi:hypothetical protein